jgi:hypothetical protein
VEGVQQHKTRGPDRVPMQGGPRRIVLEALHLGMAGCRIKEPTRMAFLRGPASRRTLACATPWRAGMSARARLHPRGHPHRSRDGGQCTG